MAIPEKQLEIWSNQGAVQTSANTHKSITSCIEKANWNSNVNYETFLQGSYPNYTNIYGNSDVDLVVEFNSIFSKNLNRLTETQRKEFDTKYAYAKYSLASFKEAVIKQLKFCYGDNNVEVGNKAILVKGDGKRLDCDVILCNPYRNYISFSANSENYIEGIIFRTEHETPNRNIINYPKVHLKNGSLKNQQENTKGNFKPSVRILKNMKASMIDRGYITNFLAPSYFLECLIYNSDNSNFCYNTYSQIAISIINQFSNDIKNRKMINYLVQNEQNNLFGTKEQQWNIEDATMFINQIIKFWNEY